MTKIIFVHGMSANSESWNGVEKDAKITNLGETSAVPSKATQFHGFHRLGCPMSSKRLR